MTIGEYLSSISTVTDVAAITHMMNIGTVTIEFNKIKSFSVVKPYSNGMVVLDEKVSAVMVSVPSYRVVYKPKDMSLIRDNENIIIKEG